MKEKAYAKVNIFLKIVGVDGDYHLINSRFMKVKNLYDVIEIKEGEKFNIIGDINCALRDNTVFKAYLELTRAYPEVKEWFIGKEIHIKKNIPEMAGLGGGSSDAAAFLRLVNRHTLNLPNEKLAEIGSKIGSDVPFFIYDYNSANVSGKGEIVEEFNEDLLNIEVFTPPVECSTKEVYKYYRQNFFNPNHVNWQKEKSIDILNSHSPNELNDLFMPALMLYPELNKYKDFGYFSGSGSSFFKIKSN